jgi:hypothetical protein
MVRAGIEARSSDGQGWPVARAAEDYAQAADPLQAGRINVRYRIHKLLEQLDIKDVCPIEQFSDNLIIGE